MRINWKRKKSITNESHEEFYLYHGSDVEFDEFDEKKIGTGEISEAEQFGRGYYFTTDYNVALKYGKNKVEKYSYYTSALYKYSSGAEKVNIFRIKGNILDASTFTISDRFKRYIIKSYRKHSGVNRWSDETINDIISYSRINKLQILNFSGELPYLISQIGDKYIVDDIASYIKKEGYDGVKVKSEFHEGTDYIIYNKKCIDKKDTEAFKMSTEYNI